MTTNPPQHASDFKSFSKSGQICHICSRPGVVLAQEVFTWNDSPIWFCSEHWPEYEQLYNIVEDKREKESNYGTA